METKNELYQPILSKKAKAIYILNISEWLLILVSLGAAVFTFWTTMNNVRPAFFMYILSIWMLVVALLVTGGRVSRVNSTRRYDRSIHGELRHGLAVAGYQVKLSRLMRWNIIIIGGLILLGMWQTGKAWWMFTVTVVVFLLTYYASGFEHQCYLRQRERLRDLSRMLNN